MKQNYRHLLSIVLSTSIAGYSAVAQEATVDEDIPVLEAFIADESEAALADSVMPTDRDISGLFGDARSVLDVPRSVTLISPKMMEQFQIDDLRDLEKIGAGTQAINYYGVPGSPTIRGVKGGTYLNGMLRAFNRNEMPLSFGSLEAIEIVKGPAPADFSPTLIGGFVNLVPKSPFFDEERGSIKIEADNWGKQKLTVDYGAPFLLPGETPAAYRVSITNQDGESYYDDFKNDFTSIYSAIKFRPKDGVSVFLGGEYFDYQSNENAGWNRPTQDLIDNGNYVIGEPIDQTSAAWRGTVNRDRFFASPDAADFIGGDTKGVGFANLAVSKGVAEASLPTGAGGLADMAKYDPDRDGVVDAYVYTQQFFDNGGKAITRDIEGDTVLTDGRDFANSEDFVFFGDVVFDSNPDRTYTLKGFFENLETEKLSSYGYALNSEQTVLSGKGFVVDRTWLPKTSTTLGVQLRYTDAKQLQDFWDEPFSRRDITEDVISPNSVVLAGPQRPIGGNNLWLSRNGFGTGGNVESELLQASVFGTLDTQWTDRLSTFAGFRAEYDDFDIDLPSEVEGVTQADIDGVKAGSGDKDFFNWAIGGNFEVIDGVSLYANYQEGTSMDPLQSGPIAGEGNFAENEMWEVGVKTSLLEDRLFASLAYYEWEQSNFNERSAQSEPLEGEGVEFEVTFLPTDQLSVIASYTYQEVRFVGDSLPFRTTPARAGVAEDEYIALNSGRLLNDFNSDVTSGNNSDLVYPGTPQTVIKLFAIYDFQNGFELSGGPIYQDEFFLNIDETIELPDALIWNLNLKYSNERWEIIGSVENLTDEEYFLGSDPIFAANTLVAKAPERTFNLSVKYKF